MPIGLGIGIGITIAGAGQAGGEAIPRIQLSGLSIAEDASVDDVIGTLSVANSEASWTFSITSDPDSKFKIANDDELQLDDTLDYETATSHLVTIEADNGVDDPISRQFTITVTNVLEVTLNELSLDTDEIAENSAEDTVVGELQDVTSGSSLSLTDDAGGRFKLSGTDIVAGATNIDYEAATSYNITVRETHTDATNSPNDTIIAITVLDDADDTDTAPAAFEVGDWSIAAGDEEADVTISSLPDDGGDTITDIEYRVDGGSAVSSGTDDTTGFTIGSLTNDVEYDVQIRAVNSVGAGAWSDVKAVTPEADDEPAWTPASLPGLIGYWDISNLSSLFQERTGGGSTPATLNGVVGTVRDLGGNGYHLEALTDATRPILRQDGNGKFYLEFDGTDDYMETTAYTHTSPWVRMSAIDYSAITSGRYLLGGATGTGALRFSGTSLALYDGGEVTFGSATADSPEVITERHNGTQSRGAIDNGSYTTGNTFGGASAGVGVGGDASGSNNSTLKLYALIESDDDLGDADIALARTWLGNKIGISL